MRLEEFDTKYPIVYTPGDVESMRDALGKYTDLVISGEAFEDDYCLAHFVHSCDKLPLSYFEKHTELMKIIRSEHYYSSSMREEEIEDVQSMMTGETLFFICAMMHPELELDVKKACEGIVKYARSKNDSSRMWLTCEYPFGVEPLYITARTYPKYGYLLASFLVPYWDDEHMPEALFELASWTSKVGITEDSIKAFCYCDNSRARENVLGYDTWDGGGEEPVESDFDLVTYFRENNDAYEAFIDQLAVRYEETPFLQTYEDDEREYIENPIVSLVLDMLYVHHPYDVWDDDFDRDEYLLNHFVKGSAEQDIDYIKRKIEEKLKRPIVKPIEEIRRETEQREREEKLERRSIQISETKKWEDFIKKVFDIGDELWQYVMNGENAYLLESLKPVDLAKLADENGAMLAEDFVDAARYGTLSEDLYRIIRGFVYERCQIDYHTDNEIAREEVFRLYDILHLAMDRPPIHSEMVEVFADDYELAEVDEIYERYKADWKELMKSLALDLEEWCIDAEDEIKLLDRIYAIVNERRVSDREVISSWFSNADEIEDDVFSIRPNDVTKQGYGFIGMYIVFRDKIQGINDDLTCKIKTFVGEFVAEFVTENIAQDELIDNYLKSGLFKDFDYEQSFDEALKYFKENLEIEENSIAENQMRYELFCKTNDEMKLIVKMAFLASELDDFSHSGMLKRVLKLSFDAAPMMTIEYLKSVIPELMNPEHIEEFVSQLSRLRNLGLSDSAFWIYQLSELDRIVDKDDMHDIYGVNAKDETEYMRYYMKLLKLYFEKIDVSKHSIDVRDLMDLELKRSQIAIREGGKLIPRDRLSKIIQSAIEVLGLNMNYVDMLDELAADKLRRELEHNLLHLQFYIENCLKNSNIEYESRKIHLFDEDRQKNIDLLESYGARVLSKEELALVEEKIESGYWNTVVVNKSGGEFFDVHRKYVMDYIYTQLKDDGDSSIGGFDLICAKGLSHEATKGLKSLESIDYRAFWMSCIDKFMNYEVPFSYVRDLLKSVVSEYHFFDNSGYYDIYMSDVFLDLGPKMKNRIVHIIGAINPAKLDFVESGSREYYMNFMFDQKLDRDIILDYLIYIKSDYLIESLALKTDISDFVKKLKIDDQVSILKLIAKYPPYHPLIVELENHKSMKIQTCIKSLIEKYNIKASEDVGYHIVDYGVYSMDSGTKDSKDNPGNKTASGPRCIDMSDSFEGKNGMYFGLRFTADEPALAPKVCIHKVVVTHPFRDESGDIVIRKSMWDQNGYSNSNIFMGWFFDEEEEVLSGEYKFEAIDTDGNLLVEKIFVVV